VSAVAGVAMIAVVVPMMAMAVLMVRRLMSMVVSSCGTPIGGLLCRDSGWAVISWL
jgi:hypothetical protein